MVPYIKNLGVYELIAFVIGFALLAFELAASRVLAPTIGSSTYIWTSVIGVIIAALSLGYAAGGIVADKRTRQSDIVWLLLFSAAAVLFAQLFAEVFLASLSNLRLDVRLQATLASLLLFMPASFVLGMISPYLARLKTTAVTNTGRSVASLSALNAIGGIVGTFMVGFVFFGYIGTKETLIFIIVLLIAASWTLVPKYRTSGRLSASFVILFVSLFGTYSYLNGSVLADLNTPTARYQVKEGEYQGKPVKALVTGPLGYQSGVYADDSSELVFKYTRTMAELALIAPKNSSILMLGGGALTIPAYLADKLPDSQIDVVEIDPRLETISKDHFNYYDRPNVRFIGADARSFLRQNDHKYDVILVDVYTDLSIPFSLATVEYARSLNDSLGDGGIAVANIAAGDNKACAPYLRGLHGSYSYSFKNYSLLPQSSTDLSFKQNIVAVYSNSPLEWMDKISSTQIKTLPSGQKLTDNFAPVERLSHRCLG